MPIYLYLIFFVQWHFDDVTKRPFPGYRQWSLVLSPIMYLNDLIGHTKLTHKIIYLFQREFKVIVLQQQVCFLQEP